MDYAQLTSHQTMLRDEPRTEAFRKAIMKVVKEGDVVLDVGSGTGILSMFAAQAGAKRVYAVELSETSSLGAHLAALNGFSDVIVPLHGDIRAVQLDEQVDVIISEWMGTIGVDENMYGAVLWARDHFLKDGGTVIPRKVTAHLAPVTTSMRTDTSFFYGKPYGLNLAPIGEQMVNDLLMSRYVIRPGDLGANAKELWVSDAKDDTADVVRAPYVAELDFTIGKECHVTALGAWFTADLAPGVTLSNAPDAAPTHWGQLILPCPERLHVKKGEKFKAQVLAQAVGPGPLQMMWSVAVGDEPGQAQDTMGGELIAQHTPAPEGDETGPPGLTELGKFLAKLAADTELYVSYLTNPEKTMESAGLSKAQKDALMSGSPEAIHAATYGEATS